MSLLGIWALGICVCCLLWLYVLQVRATRISPQGASARFLAGHGRRCRQEE